MFKNFFKDEGNTSKTGFFKIDNKILFEIDQIPGNGSINNCIESLGYPINHIRMVYVFDSNKIDGLGFKILSKELVFALAKSPQTKLSYSDVQTVINQIDWSFEYSSLNVEDILEEGVNLENLDLNFLRSVIDLNEEGQGLYKSNRLGLYLQFDNDVLKSFTSIGFDNSATKWIKDLNPMMLRQMMAEAKQYQHNEIDSMEEVNEQAKSLLNIPHAMNNEFIPLHTTSSGNVNFYNLLIRHYTKDCKLDDFLFMNKGRYRNINANTIEVGNFIYSFDTNGLLEDIVEK